MSQTQSSIQDAVRRAGLAHDAAGHDTVGHDSAGDVAEQVRRMLANPRRTRR